MNMSMKRALLAMAIATGGITAVGGGTAGAVIVGREGCTPGYWKNHTESWEEITPSTTFASVGIVGAPAGTTFLAALQGGGGSGISGATQILLRAAAAAWLNAAHDGLGYPYRRYDAGLDGRQPLRTLINAALASNDRQTILDLASTLDAANNLGCPL